MANKPALQSNPLFPILPPAAQGIARLAAEAEHADDGHLIEFKALAVRSLMNKSISKRRLWMAWSINPYRGCEFACRYCYARYTHEFMSPKFERSMEPYVEHPEIPASELEIGSPEAFERRIFIKQNAAWLLAQELKRVKPEEEIAIGTATDPYQPIERRARVTRSILEVLAAREGYRIGIVTKSNLIVRDLDLLTAIAARNRLVVHLTITTPDAELARKLEPRAPRPDLRFAAIKALRAAGLRAGILNSPLLPGITDNAVAMGEMARRAAEVNASFYAAGSLFLKPCSRPTYFAFVREHFPELETETMRRFAQDDFAPKLYQQRMSAIVVAVCRKYGVGERRMTDVLLTQEIGEGKKPAESVRLPMQQSLFG